MRELTSPIKKAQRDQHGAQWFKAIPHFQGGDVDLVIRQEEFMKKSKTTNISGLAAGLAAALMLSATPTLGADESSYGTPNRDNSRFADYAFFRGEWEASITIIGPNGARQDLDSKSRITAYYLEDGRTVQTCFRAPGFYSTSLRAFDDANDEWRAHFLNAQLGRWSGFAVKKVGNTMETVVPGGFAGTESFDVKTIEHDITNNSFKSHVFRRQHGSEDWVQTYEMRYKKLPENPNGPQC